MLITESESLVGTHLFQWGLSIPTVLPLSSAQHCCQYSLCIC
jgi:hypothetical protein